MRENVRKLRREREEARQADLAKTAFMADLSHEMRTSLSAIIALTEMALASHPDSPMRPTLESVRSATDNLLALVGDVLDLSAIAAGKLEMQTGPFDVRSFVHSALEPCAALARAKGLGFSIHVAGDLPRVLVGDAIQLGQVLVNLASNGVKYTPKGEVTVDIRPSDTLLPLKDGEQAVAFTVRDTGLGIPEEHHSRLCTAFHRVISPDRSSIPGTGLGLAIVKRLTEFMGGMLSFQSAPGKGSAFTICLPLAAGTEKRESVEIQEVLPCVPEGLKILLAEDNAVNRKYAQHLLEDIKADILVAADGLEALEVLASAPDVDLILMDIQMPGMDGLTCLQAIRDGQVAGLRTDVPVLALTAYATAGDREKFLEKGMNGYVAKPFRREELLRAMADVLPAQENTCAVQLIPSADTTLPVPDMTWKSHAAPDLDGALGSLFEGDDESLREMLDIFLAQTENLETSLAEAVAAGMVKDIALRCHRLAGAAGLMHHGELRAQALAMEQYAWAGDVDGVSQALPGLLEQLSTATNVVKEYLEE